MSKIKLKRELAELSREQLIEVILDAYAARKEIKEYFDFFAEPDVDKLTEKYRKEVAREFSRSKWGSSKARISRINNMVKDFEGFNPGSEHVVKFYLYTIQFALLTQYQLHFSETLMKGTAKLITKALDYADRHGESETVIRAFDNILNPDTPGCSRLGRRLLSETIQSYNASMAILKPGRK